MNKISLTMTISSVLLTWFFLGMARAASMNKPIHQKDNVFDKLICLPIFLFAAIFDKDCQENFLEYVDPRKNAEIIDFQKYKNRKRIG